MESQFYTKTEAGSVECLLCPHYCKIKSGRQGICGTRVNRNGILESSLWGVIASSSLDPIEKKPLYHFFPGKMIYSIGGYGCNLKCLFCQNFEISQYIPQNIDIVRVVPPETIVKKAKFYANNIGIAFTYNEPIISLEYMVETAKLSKVEGMKNVMVSNGYINPEPLAILFNYIDAFNIDLKSFNDSFYKKIAGGKLEPVLNSLKAIRKSGKHLEVTFLVVTNLNDNPAEAKSMFNWLANELGEQTILHISSYHPAYLLNNNPTKPETLEELYHLAKEKLQYVYLGNIHTLGLGHDTICPHCGNIIIKRNGFNALTIDVKKNGSCKNCDFGPIVMNS